VAIKLGVVRPDEGIQEAHIYVYGERCLGLNKGSTRKPVFAIRGIAAAR
jgi:hypothetical protein